MIPIYGFLESDTIGLLIMAYPDDTADGLIKKLQNSAAIRVKPRLGMCLRYKNATIKPETTVVQMGLQPLDHVFVVHEP